MAGSANIGLGDIERARSAISQIVRLTPVESSAFLSERFGFPVGLKLEHHQITGSFKLRGAANAIRNLNEEQRRAGVVAVSTGNHGRGLAYAAKESGVRCIVCMSDLVPRNKIDGIRALGAEVRIVGASQDDAEVEVERLISEEGMTHVPPFDHPDIISGQGTIGLELLDQAPELSTVLVPVSGGGLISGIAAVLKTRKPEVRVVGVSMERGAAMVESQRAGRPIAVPELETLADALGGGIGLENRFTFDMVRDLVDDLVLVGEEQIAGAVHHAYWHERQIVEGSGAVGIAALLGDRVEMTGPTVVLLSGGNIDMKLHHRLISDLCVGSDR